MTNGIFDVAVLVGSLRKESWNLKLAKAMTKLAPQNLKLESEALKMTGLTPDEFRSRSFVKIMRGRK